MDYGSIVAAGITAAGNVSGGLISGRINQERSQENLRYGYKLANEQLKIAPSYQMMGYRNAGINPFVEGASDFQGVAPTVPETPQVGFGNLGSDTMAAFQQSRLADSQVQLQQSEAERNYVSSEEGRANVALIRANTKCSKQQAQNLALEFYKIQSDIDVAYQMKDKIFSDTLLNYANIENTEANTENTRQETVVTKLKQTYQDLMNKSLDKYIHVTLPKTWKKLDADIDVAKTQKDLNRINYASISQQVTLQEMDVMQASEALSNNIKAAGVESQKRLIRAYLGLKEAEIDKALSDKSIYLRLASRMLGMMSHDMQTDIVSCATSAVSNLAGSAIGAVGGLAGKL